PVPAVIQEGKRPAVRDRTEREREGVEVDTVPGALVVVCETGTSPADPREPLRKLDPVHLAGAGRLRCGRLPCRIPGRSVRRTERVRCQHVLDVRQDQLLMLLLMVQPELEDRGSTGKTIRPGVRQEVADRAVHVSSVREDFRNRWPGQIPAPRTTVTLAREDVVRIEQVSVVRMIRA